MWSKCLVDFIAYSLTNGTLNVLAHAVCCRVNTLTGPSVIQADLLELLSKRDDFVQLEEVCGVCKCVCMCKFSYSVYVNMFVHHLFIELNFIS